MPGTAEGTLRERYGQWALVTGASAGIGAEFARQLAAAGMDLVLVARRQKQLQLLAQELAEEHGSAVRTVCCDLVAPGGLEVLLKQTSDLPIGLLVNNAGAPAFHGHFVQRSAAELEETVNFNVRVQLRIVHHFLRSMAERRCGGMIQVASVTGHVSMPFMVEYSASKAYQLTMGEALHYEMRQWGVDCLVLSPGATRSERIDYGMPVEPVVRAALKRLGRAPVVIPGLGNAIRMFIHRQWRTRRGMINACGRFQLRHLRSRPWESQG